MLLVQLCYMVVDKVLYFVDPKLPHWQKGVVPKCLCLKIMEEIHAGFWGTLSTERLVWHTFTALLWWNVHWCPSLLQSLTCAIYRGAGCRWRPLLQPIPVGGPFERVGEDILEMLLYGRGARIPTETALSQLLTPYMVDLDDYCTALVTGLTEPWRNARQNIAKVQKKCQYLR